MTRKTTVLVFHEVPEVERWGQVMASIVIDICETRRKEKGESLC
jgi:hypothetical protein